MSVEDVWAAMALEEASVKAAYKKKVSSVLSGEGSGVDLVRTKSAKHGARGKAKKVMQNASCKALTATVGSDAKTGTASAGAASATDSLAPAHGTAGGAPDLSVVFDKRAEMPPKQAAEEILSRWQRNINRFSDPVAAVRLSALNEVFLEAQAIEARYATSSANCPANDDVAADAEGGSSSSSCEGKVAELEVVMSRLLDGLAKPLFRALADRTGPCREVSTRLATLLLRHTPDLTPHLPYLWPVVMARGIGPDVASITAFDRDMEVFVYDLDDHEAYRRGRATERQDRATTLPHRVVEPGEDVRALVVQLVAGVVEGAVRRGAAAVLRPYFDDLALFAQYHTHDQCPDTKVEACDLITFMARAPSLEQPMKHYAVAFVRAVLPSLRHRHARVRMAALAAVWALVQVPDRAKCKGAGTAAIVDLVGFREDNVLPIAGFYGKGDTCINHLAELATDTATAVRLRVADMLGDWLTHLPDRYDHHSRLLPYVLNALTDDCPQVVASAMATLAACGAEYEREHHDQVIERRQYGVDGDVRCNHSKALPPPFAERPRIGVRLYVRSNARRFLRPLLRELCDWRSQTRLQSALLLRTLLVFCEEALTADSHEIVPQMQKAVQAAAVDKDEVLLSRLCVCLELLGRFLLPSSYLAAVLPRLRGDPELGASAGADAAAREALLVLLTQLLQGTAPKTLLPHAAELVATLTDVEGPLAAAADDSSRVRVALLGAVAAAVSSLASSSSGGGGASGARAAVEAHFLATGRLTDLQLLVRRAAQHLLPLREDPQLRAQADACLGKLADLSALPSTDALVAHHAPALLSTSISNCAVGAAWGSGSGTASARLLAIVLGLPAATAAILEAAPSMAALCQRALDAASDCSAGQREDAIESAVAAPLSTLICAGNTCNASPPVPPSELIALCLHPAWELAPRLRLRRLELLDKALAHFSLVAAAAAGAANAAGPQHLDIQAATAAARVLTAAIEDPLVPVDERKRALESADTLLSCVELPADAGSRLRLVPFAKRRSTTRKTADETVGPNLNPAAAVLYGPLVRRLDDSADAVREAALQPLGSLLPFVPPPPPPESSGAANNDTSSTSGRALDERFCYTNLVRACVAHIDSSSSDAFLEGLDGLLRRTAVLQPAAFLQEAKDRLAVERAGRGTRESGAARLLDELVDHAELLLSFQNS